MTRDARVAPSGVSGGAQPRRRPVADRKKLGIIGCVLSGATAVVMGVGIFVVQGHLTGRYSLDDSRPVASASSPTIAP